MIIMWDMGILSYLCEIVAYCTVYKILYFSIPYILEKLSNQNAYIAVYLLILCIHVYSWCLHPPSLTTSYNFTSGRGYPEFCAAWLESTTRCHRIYSTLER